MEISKHQKIADRLGVDVSRVVIVNGEDAKLTDRELTESEKQKIAHIFSGLIVAKYKIEIILREDGEWQDVLDAVSQADQRTQIAFEKASEWNRYSNAVEMIRKVLGKTHEQVDNIFEEANKIEI